MRYVTVNKQVTSGAFDSTKFKLFKIVEKPDQPIQEE
jgi:LPS O-antigen subunit length determinant protein (WzzB/FepE family)